MIHDNDSESKTVSPAKDLAARRHGRMGLTISWESIPWWGIIILIVCVLTVYSMLNSARYLEAINFILDLPWNRQALGRVEVED